MKILQKIVLNQSRVYSSIVSSFCIDASSVLSLQELLKEGSVLGLRGESFSSNSELH